jgi:hypothetical protein
VGVLEVVAAVVVVVDKGGISELYVMSYEL